MIPGVATTRGLSRVPPFRFRHHQRIHLQRDFARVFARRCVVSDGLFVLYVDDAGNDHARLGIKIGRPAGSSPVRNREKRRLREAFRLLQHELPTLDFVCVIKGPAVSAAWYREALARLAPAAQRKLIRRLSERK
jgi:ribonuclease P protein component